ncbi:hypothetical protein BgiMline_027786 [Biomphalaria glabrata]|nr:hypothetical protein BgiMline_013647 [Biomphalaria glabrata]
MLKEPLLLARDDHSYLPIDCSDKICSGNYPAAGTYKLTVQKRTGNYPAAGTYNWTVQTRTGNYPAASTYKWTYLVSKRLNSANGEDNVAFSRLPSCNFAPQNGKSLEQQSTW